MMRALTYSDSGVLAFLRLDHLKETAVILNACGRKQAWKIFTRHLAGGFLHVFINGKGEGRILQPYLVGCRF